jgi:tyrosine-protein kinase
MRTNATQTERPARDEPLDAIERDILGRPRLMAGAGRVVAREWEEPQGLTLQAIVRVLRRRWLIVALCTAAATAGALALSLRKDEQYESSATLLFRSASLGTGVFDASSTRPSDVDRAAATNLELAGLRVVADLTAKRLKEPGVTGSVVASKMDVSAKKDSDLTRVTAKTGNPELSSRMANTYATEYIAFRRDLDRASVRASLETVRSRLAHLAPRQRATATGRSLRRVARQLQVAESLRTGSAELVQRAKASNDPVSPRPKRDAGIGLLLGLMLGVSLAFVREFLDRHLNDEADVEQAFGLPVLANVPRTRDIWKTASPGQSSPRLDAFRMLRAKLHYLEAERDLRSLLVTSAERGEGRSAVAWNLALAEAQAGRLVVVIETDLRSAGLARRLKLPGSEGLNLLLAGAASFEECSLTVPTPSGRLDLVLAGPAPRNPSVLLESHAMQSLIEEATRHYDVVILDAAPASIVSDTAPLLRLVDGVLVVARLGQTKSNYAAELSRQLDKLGAPAIGVVVNEGGRL